LAAADPEVAEAIQREADRQRDNLELIASENYVSARGPGSAGLVLTNKYAEGYPGNRYYGGCEYVDIAENLARDRAKATVRRRLRQCAAPLRKHRRTWAVYFTFLRPGDTLLGMDLSHGGHLTHGSPVNFSGQLYRFVAYGVNRQTEQLDYDQVAEIAKKERPKMITVGASAYSRAIDYARFRAIADSVEAFLFADIAHPAGLIAKVSCPARCRTATWSPRPPTRRCVGPAAASFCWARIMRTRSARRLLSPGETFMMSELLDKMVVPGIQGGPLMHAVAAKAVGFGENLQPDFADYAAQVIRNAHALAAAMTEHGYHVISGGTDNHLMLIDLTAKGITGKEAETILDVAGITVNKNTIPFETSQSDGHQRHPPRHPRGPPRAG